MDELQWVKMLIECVNRLSVPGVGRRRQMDEPCLSRHDDQDWQLLEKSVKVGMWRTIEAAAAQYEGTFGGKYILFSARGPDWEFAIANAEQFHT